MTTPAKLPIVHPELSGILKLKDPRFVLPFNPLAGLPIRLPQPQPDPAPEVRGFMMDAQPAEAGETTEDDVAGFAIVMSLVALALLSPITAVEMAGIAYAAKKLSEK